MDLEHCRKDAKALVRAHRAGNADAIGRAQKVLGLRAQERFLLSDAQHVVAVEHGHGTWPELKHAIEAAALAPPTRSEELVDTGLEYAPGEPVLVRVVRRDRRTLVTDDGAAARKAGPAPGWREVGRRLEDELVVNVSRHGVVFLPVVAAGPGLEAIVRRIAEASLALYQELLDLEP